MSSVASIDWRFEPGTASVDELQREISAALAEIPDGDESEAQSERLTWIGPDTVTVSADGKGFGAGLIVIQFFLGVGLHVVNTVWDERIWPRIKTRLGADALGKRSEELQDDTDDSDG